MQAGDHSKVVKGDDSDVLKDTLLRVERTKAFLSQDALQASLI